MKNHHQIMDDQNISSDHGFCWTHEDSLMPHCWGATSSSHGDIIGRRPQRRFFAHQKSRNKPSSVEAGNGMDLHGFPRDTKQKTHKKLWLWLEKTVRIPGEYGQCMCNIIYLFWHGSVRPRYFHFDVIFRGSHPRRMDGRSEPSWGELRVRLVGY